MTPKKSLALLFFSFIVFIISCQKELSIDTGILNPVDSAATNSGRLKGFTTTYYFSADDSLKLNSTFLVDSVNHRIRIYDSIRDYDEYILNFSTDWKLRSVYNQDSTFGQTVVIDSFTRSANGRISNMFTLDENNAIQTQLQILREEDMGDSIKTYLQQILPATPDVLEQEWYYVTHKASQRILSHRNYRKTIQGTNTDSGGVFSKFNYNTDGTYLGSSNESYFKSTAAIFQYKSASSNSGWLDQGKIEDLKNLDKAIFGDDLAWYRDLTYYLTPFNRESGWRNVTLMPSAESFTVSSFLNGIPEQNETGNYSYTYRKNPNGNLSEIIYFLLTPSPNSSFISIKVDFDYYR